MEENNELIEEETVVEAEEIEAEAQEEVLAESTEEKPLSKRKQKRLAKKAKRRAKLKNKLLGDQDIKYRGPLSYRHLRIVGWIAMAAAQFLVINSISGNILEKPLVGIVGSYIINIVANLSVPLFMIAVFATILNKKKTYKSVIVLYAALYLAIGVGFFIIYRRYLSTLFDMVAEEGQSGSQYAAEALGSKVEVNVFADLLALSLFNFFINYTPTKYFQGNKRKIFRAFSILPILFAVVSYTLKVNDIFGNISLPIELIPFLATKPPLIYVVFILITLWIKYREKTIYRLGATKDEFHKYLNTNKNSLSFSLHLSFILFIVLILDFIAAVVLLAVVQDEITFYVMAASLKIGESTSLILAIPFVLLFSYTRSYSKDTSNIDLLIPLGGIGLIVLTYVEGIYEIIVAMMAA